MIKANYQLIQINQRITQPPKKKTILKSYQTARERLVRGPTASQKQIVLALALLTPGKRARWMLYLH